MASLAGILAGSRILADLIAAVAPDAAFKGADESVLNSTTLQNDDALFIPLLANSTYVWVSFVFATGAANGSGDLKFAYTWPSGASGIWAGIGLNTTGVTPNITAGRNASAASVAYGLNGGTLASAVTFGSVITGSTAGNLQTQWSQNTANNVTATTVKAGSALLAWQVA